MRKFIVGAALLFTAFFINASEINNELTLLFISSLVDNENIIRMISEFGFICYLLTQIRAWIPNKFVRRLPKPIIQFIEILAGNYKASKNENNKNNKISD